jgi:hypothetical protein
MKELYFGEGIVNAEKIEQIDPVTGNPIVISAPFSEEPAVLASLIQQTPTGGGVIPAQPVEALHIEDQTLVDEPIIPNENLMDETIADDETLLGKTSPQRPYPGTNPELPAPLVSPEVSERLRTRWNEIQGKFVDEPRTAVQQADELVSEVVEQITTMFLEQHHGLEEQWKQGNEVSTEELRMALQHYRSFFNRLVV